MFERAITEAAEKVKTTLTEIQGPPDAKLLAESIPHLERALGEVASGIELMLRRYHPSWIPVWESSNFMNRAAFDLIGPCMYAGYLSIQGQWDESLMTSARSQVNTLIWKTETSKQRVVKRIQHIVDAHTGFALAMTGRIFHDAALLERAYGIKKSIKSIYIAGSDPHQCAFRVAIVTDVNDRKFVYKPSDLTFQLMLMGDRASHQMSKAHVPALGSHTDSLFQLLAAELPVLRIIPGARKDLSHYGYMEYKNRITQLPERDLPGFFRKFGKLVGVACVFGLTDLHQENCMATADGPYLIDAEMGFSYPSLATTNMVTHTAIKSALKPASAPESVVGGVFFADYNGRKTNVCALSLSQKRTPDDDNAYVKKTSGGGIVPGAEYMDNLQAGLGEVLDAVASQLAPVQQWLQLFSVVKPTARVLLDTTLMSRFFLQGVEQYFNGTLPARGPSMDFEDWVTWYGGENHSTPAAVFQPHNAVSLLDPVGRPGISVAAAGSEVELAGTHEVKARVKKFEDARYTQQEKVRLGEFLRESLA